MGKASGEMLTSFSYSVINRLQNPLYAPAFEKQAKMYFPEMRLDFIT
jgi:hypothetical protein